MVIPPGAGKLPADAGYLIIEFAGRLQQMIPIKPFNPP